MGKRGYKIVYFVHRIIPTTFKVYIEKILENIYLNSKSCYFFKVEYKSYFKTFFFFSIFPMNESSLLS